MPERTSDGNTNVRINGINYYRSIGNLGDKSVGQTLTSISGERLTEFIATADKPEFRITSIESVSAHNLELIDLTNISTLSGSLDLSIPKRLKTLKLKGTSLSSVTLPETDTLTNVELPSTITSLRITSQPNLASVSMAGLDNLQTVYIDSANSPKFDSRSFIESLYYNHQATGNMPKNITILGVDWGISDSKMLMPINLFMWLTSIPDIKITGRIAIEDKTTNPAVTFEYKNLINQKWGDVDHADPKDGLLLTYKQQAVGTATIMGNYYNEQTKHPFTLAPSSKYDNKFTKIEWSAVADGLALSEFSIDPVTGVLTTGELSKVVTNVVVSANVYYGEGEPIKVFSKTIKVYDRPAQVGDVVYFDGTYGDVYDIDGSKTAIGLCIYVAPRYTDTTQDHKEGDIVDELFNSNDKHTRIMMSIEKISMPMKNGTTKSSFMWGICPYVNYITDGLTVVVDGVRKNLKTARGTLSETTLYDIPRIKNVSSSGVAPTSAAYRDEDSELGILNGGFACINASTEWGDGFAYNEDVNTLAERTLDEPLALLAGNGYKSGDIVNSGFAKTLKIIEHRNIVLREGLTMSGIDNPFFDSMPIPTDSENKTEKESLSDALFDVKEWAKSSLGESDSLSSRWESIYYPLASLAYAYEPQTATNEIISEKFKIHNWFIPTAGLLGRVYWYTQKGGEKNALKKAMDKGLLSLSVGTYYFYQTCSETGTANYTCLNMNGTNNVSYGYKMASSHPFFFVSRF